MPLVDIIQCVIEFIPNTTIKQIEEIARRCELDIKSIVMGKNGNLPDYFPKGLLAPYAVTETISRSLEQLKASFAHAKDVKEAYFYHQMKNEPTRWERVY